MAQRSATFCLLAALLGCSTPQVQSVAAPEAHVEVKPSLLTLEEHVLLKLKENKVKSPLYRAQLQTLLKDPKKPYEKIISLNLLGFMSKADYSVHYSERAIRNTKKFLKENSRTLHYAQKKFGVSKESIAALLWVETQHGAITGRNPLVHVFLSLLMADHPDTVKALLKESLDRRAQDEAIRKRFPDTLAFEQKIVDRTQTKSAWAMEQLLAIDQLRKAGYAKILLLNGSYAGAFGVPQFIPSTYRDLAISMNKERRPNLYKMPDVIISVANFLKKKGWNENDPATKSAALYEYNRISDYGDVILKIAGEVREPEPDRLPSKSETRSTP